MQCCGSGSRRTKKNFSRKFFPNFFVIKTLDPEPDPYLDSCWIRIRIRIHDTYKGVRYFTFDPDLLLNIDGSWAVDGQLR
jgi:hypothetical protein